MTGVDVFFEELDRRLAEDGGPKVHLRVLGSTALVLQSDYLRGTKDADVFQSVDLTAELEARLRVVAGKASAVHASLNMYLDIVPNGLPFLPHPPVWRRLDAFNAGMRVLVLDGLDIVNVVVTKLKRFSRADVGDVEAMVERGLVPHGTLVKRFESAVDRWSCDARAEELPRCVKNLHRVERDMLGVDETEIELPDWI